MRYNIFKSITIAARLPWSPASSRIARVRNWLDSPNDVLSSAQSRHAVCANERSATTQATMASTGDSAGMEGNAAHLF
jgi:hypothetical protein